MKKSFWILLFISISVLAHGQQELVGVGIEPYKDFVAEDYVLKHKVKSIVKNSPAERAGIREGDFLLEVDGIELKHIYVTHVYYLLVNTPGTLCKIKVYRDEKELDFSITREADKELKYASEYEKETISYYKYYKRKDIENQASGDDDFDGVYNAIDKCRYDAGTKENNGCPAGQGNSEDAAPAAPNTEQPITPPAPPAPPVPPVKPAPPAKTDDFCKNINTVLDAYLNNFKDLRGERVQKGFEVTYKSKITIEGATEAVFTEIVDEEVGDVFYVFKADFAAKNLTKEQAEKVYNDIVNKMKACTFNSGAWSSSSIDKGAFKSTSWVPNSISGKKPDKRYNDCELSVSFDKLVNYRVYIKIGFKY